MAMPGEMYTQPQKKIVMNTPTTNPQQFTIKVINGSPKEHAWAGKTMPDGRFTLNPPMGKIMPGQTIQVILSTNGFDMAHYPNWMEDRCTIEWAVWPAVTPPNFNIIEYFSDVTTTKHKLPIEYNM